MDEILVERDGPILRVTLNRPAKRNALSRAMLSALRKAFAKHARDQELRLAILAAAGERAFAAGGDLLDLGKARTRATARKLSRQAVAALDAVREFPVPVVAALNGLAIGGGAELAVACDFRVAARHAEIGFVQGRLNIGTAFGGGTLLVDLLGARRALLAMASSRVYSAHEALQLGLVDAVAEEGESLEQALARFNAPLLAQRPQVLRAFKALALAAHEPRAARKRLEIERMVQTWTHPDHWAAAENVLNSF
jgi:enoyl-CoA hydratase